MDTWTNNYAVWWFNVDPYPCVFAFFTFALPATQALAMAPRQYALREAESTLRCRDSLLAILSAKMVSNKPLLNTQEKRCRSCMPHLLLFSWGQWLEDSDDREQGVSPLLDGRDSTAKGRKKSQLVRERTGSKHFYRSRDAIKPQKKKEKHEPPWFMLLRSFHMQIPLLTPVLALHQRATSTASSNGV